MAHHVRRLVDVDAETVAEAMRERLAVSRALDDLARRGVHVRRSGTPGAAFSIAAVCASSTIDQTLRYSSVGEPKKVERVMS